MYTAASAHMQLFNYYYYISLLTFQLYPKQQQLFQYIIKSKIIPKNNSI